MAKRILVVDDHPVFRAGLVALLVRLPDVVEVAEAAGVEDALRRWRATPFDLVTIDLSLPDGDGFTLLREARAAGLLGAALVVSMHEEHGYQVRAKLEGAAGYAAKSAGTERLVACAARCLSGGLPFQTATDLPPGAPVSLPAATAELLQRLSPTERRVIALLGRTLTSREIAKMLGVSVRTVETHRANICRKLELRGPHRLLELALAATPILEGASR